MANGGSGGAPKPSSQRKPSRLRADPVVTSASAGGDERGQKGAVADEASVGHGGK